MVKGISRRVIVVDSPDPQIFEQAIFILRTDGGGVSSQQLVDQAVRIAKNYARCQGLPRRWRPTANRGRGRAGAADPDSGHSSWRCGRPDPPAAVS